MANNLTLRMIGSIVLSSEDIRQGGYMKLLDKLILAYGGVAVILGLTLLVLVSQLEG